LYDLVKDGIGLHDEDEKLNEREEEKQGIVKILNKSYIHNIVARAIGLPCAEII
jgi:hypothetical protein